MGQTLVEKIVQKYAVNLPKDYKVKSGDIISISPAHILTHDNTGAIMKKFKSMGIKSIKNPKQPVFVLDHDIQNKSPENLKKYENIENFAKEMGVDFYPAGTGIGHQIMCEHGYAWPFTMVVASDSHANMYGGLGCLGTPVVRTDAAGIWASGKTWWQIPPVVKVELTGILPDGVTGKDLILMLCGYFSHDEVLNCAIEFTGDAIKDLSIDQRLTIANMTTEWGALVGLFPVDEKTFDWLLNRIEKIKKIQGKENERLNINRLNELKKNILKPDEDAFYHKIITIDISKVVPYVAGPHTVKKVYPINEIEKKKIKINKAYLVSCVNSRLEDIKQASELIEGKKIAEGVEFYIAAASKEIEDEAKSLGYWDKLVESGAIPLPPGCGPCIGLGKGLLKDGEVGISATNRNFKGRMGSKNAEVYLASPLIVTASAIKGYIASHKEFKEIRPELNLKTNIKAQPQVREKVKILEGFPKTIEGNIILCPQDNINTDGIYPGKYTYKDDFTPEDQAKVVMENYDVNFAKIIKKGDILVTGYNFGTGSSREQAATSLKYAGIQLVLAGSFSQTYKRNAFNNGFLVIEAPELYEDLKKRFGNDKLTINTNLKAKIDFENSQVEVEGKVYKISEISETAQELILAGGLQNWILKQLE